MATAATRYSVTPAQATVFSPGAGTLSLVLKNTSEYTVYVSTGTGTDGTNVANPAGGGWPLEQDQTMTWTGSGLLSVAEETSPTVTAYVWIAAG